MLILFYLVLTITFIIFATAKYKIHPFLTLIVASLAMIVMLYFKIDSPLIWGGLSGVALEGLGRKNWSIRRNSGK